MHGRTVKQFDECFNQKFKLLLLDWIRTLGRLVGVVSVEDSSILPPQSLQGSRVWTKMETGRVEAAYSFTTPGAPLV